MGGGDLDAALDLVRKLGRRLDEAGASPSEAVLSLRLRVGDAQLVGGRGEAARWLGERTAALARGDLARSPECMPPGRR